MFSLDIKIKELKEYFEGRPEVAMAFVFGSYAKGHSISESDFDLAVYFQPQSNAVEWEEILDYSLEDQIWSDVEKIIGVKTDLLVLNRAPSTVAYAVLQEGKPIIIKNKNLYWRLFLTISTAAEDLREFANDFLIIKQRSQSLNDIDRDRLVRILDFLESELIDYNKFKGLDQRTYESDRPIRRNVERWAENIVNASVDIAKIILASEKKKIPQTYREVLQSLDTVNEFDIEIASQLARFSKLRNILAHEYLDIRFANIDKFINQTEGIYKSLVNFVKQFLVSK